MKRDTALTVIGLGKLGAPLAGCLASHGFPTVGVDLDPEVRRQAAGDCAHVSEPGLADLMGRARPLLEISGDTAAAVRRSQLTFVIVPTPSQADGRFSLRHVLAACREIGRGLAGQAGYPVVVLTSTVMPGDTDGPVRRTLEEASGLSCGRDFGLCYSPEFIALGSVIHDLLNPDFLLVGESDPRAGDALQAVYAALCENRPPVARMSPVNAEVTKLALNTFVTTKITYANMLAHLCERLPGAHVDVVTAALGLDRRVGRHYLKGAVAYGGPCFPRDNLALAALARELGVAAPLAEVTDRANRAEAGRLVGMVASMVQPPATVGVLGLTYKPDTDVVEESQGVALVHAAQAAGFDVVAFDPGLVERGAVGLPPGLVPASSLQACVETSDALLIVTPWPQLRELPRVLGGSPRPRVVVDCWRMLDASALPPSVTLVAVGVGARVGENPKGKAGRP